MTNHWDVLLAQFPAKSSACNARWLRKIWRNSRIACNITLIQWERPDKLLTPTQPYLTLQSRTLAHIINLTPHSRLLLRRRMCLTGPRLGFELRTCGTLRECACHAVLHNACKNSVHFQVLVSAIFGSCIACAVCVKFYASTLHALQALRCLCSHCVNVVLHALRLAGNHALWHEGLATLGL